jgi:small subunit ribosomal protein S1
MSAVMEELLASSKIELLKEGSVISGTIMEVRPTEVVIDFGGKAEGTIPAHEFLDLSELEIGSDIENRKIPSMVVLPFLYLHG